MQNSQNGHSQGVLTKQRKRSLSRSRITAWRTGSTANLPADDGSGAPALVAPNDEAPSASGVMSFARHVKNRLLGSRTESGLASAPIMASASPDGPPSNGTAGGSSDGDVNATGYGPAADGPGTVNANTESMQSSRAEDNDSESIILDTSSVPLSNGSAQQVDDPVAPQPVQPASPEHAPAQPPKYSFFVPEPPPPITSAVAEMRPVQQQPPSRFVPGSDAAAPSPPVLEPPPPVRSPEQRDYYPRKSVPRNQPASAQPSPSSSTPLAESRRGSAISLGFKKLRRAGSKRTSKSSAGASAHERTTSATAVSAPSPSDNIPPPPAAIGSAASSRASSFPSQQTAAKKESPTSASSSSETSNVHPPPLPIQSHPPVSSRDEGVIAHPGGVAASSPPLPPPPQQYRYALSGATAELDSARQQCISQVSLLRQRDAQIAALSDTVDRLRLRVQDQFQQQLDVSTEKSSGLFGAAAASLPDSQVRSRWIGLRWQIRQCVETSLAGEYAHVRYAGTQKRGGGSSGGSSGGVSPTRAAQLRKLSPDYAHFLQSRTGTVCLVEAAVWTVLAQHVFGDARRSSPMCWAPPPWKALSKINDSMLCTRPADAAFHRWRAQTAVFVASTLSQEKDATAVAPYVDEVVRQLEVEVDVLLALALGRSDHVARSERSERSDAALRRQLFSIVAEAVRLDADLCQQRAWFHVHFPLSGSGKRYGMPLDPGDMEVVEQEEAMADAHSNTVSLVVRPALFKAGNSRGEAYDDMEPVERSVVCRAPAPSPQSTSSLH